MSWEKMCSQLQHTAEGSSGKRIHVDKGDTKSGRVTLTWDGMYRPHWHMTTPLVILRLYLEAELGSQSFMASGGGIPLIVEWRVGINNAERFGKLTSYTQGRWGSLLPTRPGWCWDTAHQTASCSRIHWWWTVLQGSGQVDASPRCTPLSCL